jgi:prepilin-type N-terminal cleavage/methylation domain-containing protein
LVIVVTFLVGRAVVTTSGTSDNSSGHSGLPPAAARERGLLEKARMATARRRRLRHRVQSTGGFSLIEVLIVVAIVGIVAAIAIGITPEIIRSTKGQSGAQQLSAFLKRQRETAISRRRNIEIAFTAPNIVSSSQRAVPDPPAATPAPTPLETMHLEGRVEFRLFSGVPDTPDAFGNLQPVSLGGASPVMFTSEGSFTDVNGDPINASVFVGVDGQPTTANALTIVGTTAAIRAWRWDGSRWVQ